VAGLQHLGVRLDLFSNFSFELEAFERCVNS
jgi:hypothetical protein